MEATQTESSSAEGNARAPSAARRRDRRHGLNDVLVTLSRLVGGRDPASLRGAFEETLRHVLPVRTLHLRDATSRWVQHPFVEAGESVAFEVPGPSPKTRGVLEASFDPGATVGEWEFQLLGMAAHLGSLLLEIERARGMGRIDPAQEGKGADGAAPLIGSTEAMAALRSQIERVAITDFTILLEGLSRR